ncbi:fibronectin type III domain-containing protein [Micromonospora sp. WMMD736]|uniref:fibronectin type III domain-containing protein n=1 Tax=Micromonospora sp. WMMD736 TaxID=3404112 RepID=UPI003B926BD1
MATSGTVRPSSNGIYVTWSLSSQSIANNTSTVHVTFGWGFHSSPLDRQLDNGTCQVNGVTVYSNSGRIKDYTGDLRDRDHAVWSGTRTIAHNSSGDANISLYGIMTGYSGDRISGSGTWALPRIPRLPGTPGTPSVSGHTDSDPTTASFSWTAPSNVGAGLDRRQFIIKTDTNIFAGPYIVNDVANWGTTYSATGLPKGTTMYATVRAINDDAGWADFSGLRTFTTGTTAPSAPGTPSASGIGGTSMTLSWAAPGDDGGADISSYEVQRADNSSFSVGLVSSSLPGSSRSLQVTGLTHTKAYFYRVRATNTDGKQGPFSATGSATTAATPPTQPLSLAAGDRKPTEVAVSWDVPEDPGGATITDYDLQWSTSSSFTAAASLNSTTMARNIGGLAPSTTYYFRARANNAAGAGAWSATLTTRTTSGLRVASSAGTDWLEADVWVSVAVPGGYEWRRCLVKPL